MTSLFQRRRLYEKKMDEYWNGIVFWSVNVNLDVIYDDFFYVFFIFQCILDFLCCSVRFAALLICDKEI